MPLRKSKKQRKQKDIAQRFSRDLGEELTPYQNAFKQKKKLNMTNHIHQLTRQTPIMTQNQHTSQK